MKGKYFGVEPTRPCSHCGTPRIAYDYDDECYVVPGYIEGQEYREIKCGRPVITDKVWILNGSAPEPVKEVCPDCGGRLVCIIGKRTSGPHFGTEKRIYYCERGKHYSPEPRGEVRKLEGCPQCREYHSI
jgi:hypothetical protein